MSDPFPSIVDPISLLKGLPVRYLLLPFILLMLLHCGTQPDHLGQIFHDPVPAPEQTSTVATFPKAALLDSAAHRHINEAASLDDLLVFDRLVQLETNETSIFGDVTDLIVVDDAWWIVDRLTQAVYRFDQQGSFQGKVGEFGQGPGEFQAPRRIFHAFDDQVAVTDPMRGQVLLFDKTGAFVMDTPILYDGKAIRPNNVIHWPEKDRLFVVGFFTTNGDTPVHVVVDPIAQKVRYGFGPRHSDIHAAVQKGMGVRAHTAFTVIDDQLWSGSPYTTTIDVFDIQGRKLARLGENVPRDPEEFIQTDDWRDIHKKSDPEAYMRDNLLRKMSNVKILPLGDVVFAQIGFHTDVYDRHGNLIRANLPIGDYLSRNFTSSEHFIKVWTPGAQTENLDPAAREAVQAMKAAEDQNPVLVLYRLKTPGPAPSDAVTGE